MSSECKRLYLNDPMMDYEYAGNEKLQEKIQKAIHDPKLRCVDKTGTPWEGVDEIMEDAMDNIQDAFNITDEALCEAKKWGFSKAEIDFIKSATPRKPFHFKRMKGLTFIKTSDNLLMTADQYLLRLESGIINIAKRNEKIESKYQDLKELYVDFQNKYCNKRSFSDRIKIALKLILKGGLDG